MLASDKHHMRAHRKVTWISLAAIFISLDLILRSKTRHQTVHVPPASITMTTTPTPKNLILVCGHAIFVGPSPDASTNTDIAVTTNGTPKSTSKSHEAVGGSLDPHDPTQWHLAPFQLAEAPTFTAHVQAGLDALRRDPAAVLVFSGGATKRGITPVTEAAGYARIARLLATMRDQGSTDGEEGEECEESIMHRVFEEGFATDSFQNVLFGLLGFGIWTGQTQQGRTPDQKPTNTNTSTNTSTDTNAHAQWPPLPTNLTIISHAFKHDRFMHLHLPAIRALLPSPRRPSFDVMRVTYIGINPPFSLAELADISARESAQGYEPWAHDRFGRGAFLDGKRRARGWDEGEYLGWWRGEVGGEERVLEDVRRIVTGVAVEE